MPDLVRVKTPQGRHAHLRLEGNVSALCGSNAPFEPGGEDLPLCANCERRKERVRVGAVGQGDKTFDEVVLPQKPYSWEILEYVKWKRRDLERDKGRGE